MRARTGLTIILACYLISFGFLAGCTPGRAQVRERKGFNENNYSADNQFETNSFGEESGEFGEDTIKNDPGNRSRGYSVRETAGNRGDGDSEERRTHVRFSESKKTPSETSERYIADEERSLAGRDGSNADRSFSRREYYQTGMASWYGREFHGRITASGEKFDMNGLTAAHTKIPFGTILEVTNFDNGKTARVRVNDRGPYRGNRIMDLSYAAAKKLGMVSPGKAMVGIRILGERRGKRNDSAEERYSGRKSRFVEPVVRSEYNDREESVRGRGNYSVQAGAFYSRRNAEKLKGRIEALTRNSVVIINEGDLYKVRIEGVGNKGEAGRFKRMLADEEINSFILEKE